MKLRKYLVALTLDETAEIRSGPDCGVPFEEPMKNGNIAAILPQILPPSMTESPDSPLIELRERARIEDGREKVIRKLHLFIRDPNAEDALKRYACERFGRNQYEELNVEELLTLWHEIGTNRELLSIIYDKISNRTVLNDSGKICVAEIGNSNLVGTIIENSNAKTVPVVNDNLDGLTINVHES